MSKKKAHMYLEALRRAQDDEVSQLVWDINLGSGFVTKEELDSSFVTEEPLLSSEDEADLLLEIRAANREEEIG